VEVGLGRLDESLHSLRTGKFRAKRDRNLETDTTGRSALGSIADPNVEGVAALRRMTFSGFGLFQDIASGVLDPLK
jgi:hypothetical protein